MYATIQKWGNSSAIRLPKAMLEAVLLKQDDDVEMIADGDKIIIKKAYPKKHTTLEERLKGFEGTYSFEEADWGKPTGNEIW